MAFAPQCGFCRGTITGRLNRVDGNDCCDRCFATRTGRDTTAFEQKRHDVLERQRDGDRRQAVARRLNTGARPQKKQYKVMTRLDGFFSGVFNAHRLQDAINKYAAEGWTVVSMTTAAIPGLASNQDELLVLFERDFIQAESIASMEQDPPDAPGLR